ncbi:unnamed protein product, partial [Didymodactylos carnosus]
MVTRASLKNDCISKMINDSDNIHTNNELDRSGQTDGTVNSLSVAVTERSVNTPDDKALGSIGEQIALPDAILVTISPTTLAPQQDNALTLSPTAVVTSVTTRSLASVGGITAVALSKIFRLKEAIDTLGSLRLGGNVPPENFERMFRDIER